MKIRKDVIFAVLTTFCMCALMFTVIPIRSGLPYDPWADIDDNGKIDMKDIGNVAAQFMTSGDPTKNVNVTNWVPPEPTVIYCGTWSFQWNSSGTYGGPIGSIPIVYIGDYERMTVTLNFSYIGESYGRNYFSARADWYNSPSDSLHSSDTLTSTLYQIQGIPYSSVGHVTNVSTDSYPIKGPYVQINPSYVGLSYYGNVTFSIYIYVSHGPTVSSLHKTMNWHDYEQNRIPPSGNVYYFGYFDFSGFSTLDILFYSNVTGTIEIWSALGYILLDQFSIGPPIATYKTYTLHGGIYSFSFYASSLQFIVGAEFWVTT